MEPTQLSAQIRRLQVVVAVLIAMQVVTFVAIAMLVRPDSGPVASEPWLPDKAREIDEWSKLPIEEKVRRSSAVVIATFTAEGPRVKAIATEVIVRDPTAKVYYVPGEEARSLSYIRRGNADSGDGTVALLTGSPASFRESYSYRDGRIASLGDMPLEELKRMARSP